MIIRTNMFALQNNVPAHGLLELIRTRIIETVREQTASEKYPLRQRVYFRVLSGIDTRNDLDGLCASHASEFLPSGALSRTRVLSWTPYHHSPGTLGD